MQDLISEGSYSTLDFDSERPSLANPLPTFALNGSGPEGINGDAQASEEVYSNEEAEPAAHSGRVEKSCSKGSSDLPPPPAAAQASQEGGSSSSYALTYTDSDSEEATAPLPAPQLSSHSSRLSLLGEEAAASGRQPDRQPPAASQSSSASEQAEFGLLGVQLVGHPAALPRPAATLAGKQGVAPPSSHTPPSMQSSSSGAAGRGPHPPLQVAHATSTATLPGEPSLAPSTGLTPSTTAELSLAPSSGLAPGPASHAPSSRSSASLPAFLPVELAHTSSPAQHANPTELQLQSPPSSLPPPAPVTPLHVLASPSRSDKSALYSDEWEGTDAPLPTEAAAAPRAQPRPGPRPAQCVPYIQVLPHPPAKGSSSGGNSGGSRENAAWATTRNPARTSPSRWMPTPTLPHQPLQHLVFPPQHGSPKHGGTAAHRARTQPLPHLPPSRSPRQAPSAPAFSLPAATAPPISRTLEYSPHACWPPPACCKPPPPPPEKKPPRARHSLQNIDPAFLQAPTSKSPKGIKVYDWDLHHKRNKELMKTREKEAQAARIQEALAREAKLQQESQERFQAWLRKKRDERMEQVMEVTELTHPNHPCWSPPRRDSPEVLAARERGWQPPTPFDQDAWWIIQRVKQMKRPGLIANI